MNWGLLCECLFLKCPLAPMFTTCWDPSYIASVWLPDCGRPKVISLPKFGCKRHHDFLPNLLFSIEWVSLRKLAALSLDLSLKKPYKWDISSSKHSLLMSHLRSSLQTCQAFWWLQFCITLWMSGCDILTDPRMRMSRLSLLLFWDCEIHAYCCIPLSMRAVFCTAIGNEDMGGYIFYMPISISHKKS